MALTKKELKDEVKRYCENKDYFTAKNLIKTHGALIEGFDINSEVNKINKLIEKEEKKKDKIKEEE